MTKTLKLIRDFEKEAFERRNHYEIAAVPFRPDFELPTADTPYTKFKIAANILERAKGNNIVEVSVPNFECGTLEEAIVWQERVNMIIARKPVEKPDDMFALMDVVMTGEAKLRWHSISKAITVQYAPDSDRELPPVRTKTTFKASWAKWRHSWCDIKNAAKKQKRYMRNALSRVHFFMTFLELFIKNLLGPFLVSRRPHCPHSPHHASVWDPHECLWRWSEL